MFYETNNMSSQSQSPQVLVGENSPAKLDDSEAAAVIPSEEAACASFFDGTATDACLGRCSSPAASNTSNEESVDNFSAAVDPSKVITDEMLEEEKRLYSNGVKEEEKRQEENEKLLDEITDDSREKRYERLKYLLSKSTLYTEYLVGRIKKQKEEEEKRREKILKRKQKKEEEKAKLQAEQSKQAEGASPKSTRAGKRKQDVVENESPSSNPKNKRQKKSGSSTPQMKSPDGSEKEQQEDPESPVQSAESGDSKEEMDEEPQLLEKASTFGVLEEEGNEVRKINGELVPFLQPKLMEGGVLRQYQVEGYSWLKVLYENGVNGILADEMGLGKTVQCVAILSHLVYMGIPGPFLVCAPLSTIPNWFAEFQRFAPKVPTVLYHGDKDRRAHLCKRIFRKHEVREGVKVQPVVITSYEIAMIDRKYLSNHEWKYLIVDEGHRIKNTHCRLIRELRMYRSTHRLLLTGTPLQNSLAELWSLLNFLLPEIFDDLGSFEAWFDVRCMNDADSDERIVRQEQGANILGMLHQILSPFMLRRLKSDVDLCIPPKKEVLVYAPLTPEQKEYYEALVNRTIFSMIEEKNKVEEKVELTATGRPKRRSSKKIDYNMMMESDADKKRNEREDKGEGRRRWKRLEEEELDLECWVQAVCDQRNSDSDSRSGKQKTSQVTIKMRSVMMQLRKCCNHPYLLEHPLDPSTGDLALTEGVVKTSGKMLVLDKMLKELKKRGHRVLIFSQMTRMLDLIEDFCQLRGYGFCRLDGSTNVDDRRDSMNVFNGSGSEEKFLFLLSTRAGGLGINLTGADTVIIYDSDWNPQCDLQAQDRCHRIGQTKPVVVYRFVTANTIDQKIIERAAAKRKLEKMIIHKGKFKSGNFMTKAKPISPEELRDLLKSKDHEREVSSGNFTISQAEMNSLLDRSDLYAKWAEVRGEKPDVAKEKTSSPSTGRTSKSKKCQSEQAKSSKSPEESGLFKVVEVEEEEGSSGAGNDAGSSCSNDVKLQE
ncbi:lymphocyte-specific helicase isoform X2 [Aplysia californica]|uniref:Lymphocyte-specific helicase isoform X2 n=1 Tax=Aplysia californica TaxID=6500 RepID=A0ABM1VQR1_APLCA|nr:lymphocyte-specific helicase isoform X2 [Aplysia californica]